MSGAPHSTKGRYLPSLDHLRWIATLACTLNHAVLIVLAVEDRSLPARLLNVVGDFGNPALITFFVLSGFLVGGRAWRLIEWGSSAAERWRFVVDRIVRVTIVLWPALVLTALVAWLAPLAPTSTGAAWTIDRETVLGRMTAESWAGMAVLANGLLTPKPPINGPLWSMAFEWSYYVFAAAAIYLAARDRGALGMGLLAYALVLLGAGLFVRPYLLLMLVYWLAGMLASRVRGWRHPILSAGLFGGVLLVGCLHRQEIWQGALVALATAALLSDRGFQEMRVAPALATRLAGISYSVYVVHWPTMILVWSCLRAADWVPPRLPFGAAACLCVALLVAAPYAVGAIFAYFTERHTERVRAWVLRRWPVPA